MAENISDRLRRLEQDYLPRGNDPYREIPGAPVYWDDPRVHGSDPSRYYPGVSTPPGTFDFAGGGGGFVIPADLTERPVPSMRPGDIGEGLEDLFNEINSFRSRELEDDLAFKREMAERDFARKKRDTAADYAARIGAINARIADAKGELKHQEDTWYNFMDTISPGFSVAVDKAKKAAKATAAIEMTFSEAQGEIDAEYASATGRTRAIADKVAGNDPQVATALTEVVTEMKGFIDRQVTLNREQTLTMHKTAAQIAAAAARSEEAGLRGDASRNIYQTQAKYEKILTDLVRQRSALNASRARAMRSLEEARADFEYGLARDEAKARRGLELDTTVFAANSTLPDIFTAGTSMLESQWVGTENQIPAKDNAKFWEVAEYMYKDGIFDWTTWAAVNVDPSNPEQVAWGASLLQYEDRLEVASRFLQDTAEWYDETYVPNSTNPAGAFGAQMAQLQNLGLPQGLAEELTAYRMRDTFGR